MILNSVEIKRRHHETVHSLVTMWRLRGKGTVNAISRTDHRTKEETIRGRIVKEYDNYYLVDNGNYKQTILKNSLINRDTKIVSCS